MYYAGSGFAISTGASLTRYANTFDGINRLRIEIPGLGYSMGALAVQTANREKGVKLITASTDYGLLRSISHCVLSFCTTHS
jgi:hypothetical protein